MTANVDYYYGEYDDEYQGEEEEWDREQLLDPMWEKQQKKVCHFFYSQILIIRLVLYTFVCILVICCTS